MGNTGTAVSVRFPWTAWEDDRIQHLDKRMEMSFDELVSEQEKYKAITEELEQTFAEMSGY